MKPGGFGLSPAPKVGRISLTWVDIGTSFSKRVICLGVWFTPRQPFLLELELGAVCRAIVQDYIQLTAGILPGVLRLPNVVITIGCCIVS